MTGLPRLTQGAEAPNRQTRGRAAPKIGRFIPREIIGAPECPILHRWTLFSAGDRWPKLMIHHFLPNRDDRDVHDHPRGFITIVLRGGYDDLVPCAYCSSEAEPGLTIWDEPCKCARAGDPGVMVGDSMRAGMVRLRHAEHRHRTRVGPSGCWTIVAMGPLRRPWGFWREGEWLPWRDYERRFGFGMRCGDEETRYTLDGSEPPSQA